MRKRDHLVGQGLDRTNFDMEECFSREVLRKTWQYEFSSVSDELFKNNLILVTRRLQCNVCYI